MRFSNSAQFLFCETGFEQKVIQFDNTLSRSVRLQASDQTLTTDLLITSRFAGLRINGTSLSSCWQYFRFSLVKVC